jgi:hypothetical protein
MPFSHDVQIHLRVRLLEPLKHLPQRERNHHHRGRKEDVDDVRGEISIRLTLTVLPRWVAPHVFGRMLKHPQGSQTHQQHQHDDAQFAQVSHRSTRAESVPLEQESILHGDSIHIVTVWATGQVISLLVGVDVGQTLFVQTIRICKAQAQRSTRSD